jgi:hypothetical protein
MPELVCISTEVAETILAQLMRRFPDEDAVQAAIALQTALGHAQKEGIMALSLGGVTPAEIEAGLKAVDSLVELVDKLPFISSNGTFKTVLQDLDTGLKYAESVAAATGMTGWFAAAFIVWLVRQFTLE